MKQRVAALEAIVADLQSRLSKLEAPIRRSDPAAAPKNDAEPWKDKANWRRLNKGMSKAELTRIFGEPGKIVSGYHFEIWYYPSPLGGSVTIDDNNRVTGWSEP